MYENKRFGGGGRGRFNDRGPTAPVSVGDELDVNIEAVGEKGDGVAKKNNFVIFVPGVKEGENVRVRVTKVLRKVGFAEKIGEAQGPVETSQPQQREESQGSDMSVQEVMQPEPTPEDSEDFGEEPAEQAAEQEDSEQDESEEERQE